MKTALYFTLVALLIIFGIVTGFSIGIPFLYLGALLGGLFPLRGKPSYWGLLSGYVAFWVAFVLVAPLVCTAGAVSRLEQSGRIEGSAPVRCSNLLGIDYSGPMSYSPPRVYALLAGIASAAIVGVLVWNLVDRVKKARLRPGS